MFESYFIDLSNAVNKFYKNEIKICKNKAKVKKLKAEQKADTKLLATIHKNLQETVEFFNKQRTPAKS